MRQILLFAALATSLALLSGCTPSKTKADTAEDMPDKAAYHKISAEAPCLNFPSPCLLLFWTAHSRSAV